MILVELLGLPGSGKTYYLNDLIRNRSDVYSSFSIIKKYIVTSFPMTIIFELLPETYSNRIFNKIYKVYCKTKLQEYYREKHFSLYSFIEKTNSARNISSTQKKMIMNWFLELGAYYEIANRLQIPGVVVIDEGFAQRAISLFVSAEEKNIDFNNLNRYLTMLENVKELVFIRRPFKVCLQSRVKNPTLRSSDLTIRQIEDVMINCNSVVGCVYDFFLEQSINVTVIENC